VGAVGSGAVVESPVPLEPVLGRSTSPLAMTVLAIIMTAHPRGSASLRWDSGARLNRAILGGRRTFKRRSWVRRDRGESLDSGARQSVVSPTELSYESLTDNREREAPCGS
jgi:hypothetical protein